MEKLLALIPAGITAALVIFGICLMFGKATRLIPGYNVKATNEKAAFFERIYAKYVGVLVLGLSVFVAGVLFGLMFSVVALSVSCAAVGTIYVFAGMIYIANNTRAKRALYLAKELENNPDGLSDEELEKWKNELGNNKKTDK